MSRNRVARLAGAWGLAAIVVLGMSGSADMTRGEPLDEERRAQLDLGTVAQRAEVLGWLAEHGDQSTAHAVVVHLRDTDAAIRGLAEQVLWAIWTRSGNVQVDGLMVKALALMNEQQYREAVAVLDEVIRLKPDFAEGYNKRATALYVMGDYLHSLDDVEETLKRNPEHFGALSGGGLCMLKLQRLAEALDYFERALAINPNMESIRAMAEQLRKQKPKPLI